MELLYLQVCDGSYFIFIHLHNLSLVKLNPLCKQWAVDHQRLELSPFSAHVHATLLLQPGE